MGQVERQMNLAAFTALCVALSGGLLFVKYSQGLTVIMAPSEKAGYRYLITAKETVDASTVPVLKVGGRKLDLGETGLVGFETNADGVGAIPLSVGWKNASNGSLRKMSITHGLKARQVGWSGEALVVNGLEKNAQYKMEIGLWLFTKAVETGRERVWEDPGSNVDCQSGCVAAMGTPKLASLEAGPEWRKGLIDILGRTPWTSPLLLALLGLFWRKTLKKQIRKALVAAGIPNALRMEAKTPRLG